MSKFKTQDNYDMVRPQKTDLKKTAQTVEMINKHEFLLGIYMKSTKKKMC